MAHSTMKYLRTRLSAATLLLALTPFGLPIAGCSDTKSTLDEVESLKTKVCACKDAACVTALRESSKGLERKLSKLTGEEMDSALELAVEMMECATNLGVPADGL